MSASPAPYLIQALTPDLEAPLRELWTEVFGYPEPRNDPSRVLRDKREWDGDASGILVAVSVLDVTSSASRLLGSVMLGYDGHRGWLYRLAVSPDARRRGIAAALVREAEARLTQWGCAKINVQVHAHNARAAAFWQKVGYPLEERLSYGKDLNA